MNIRTRLYSYFKGRLVGTDAVGNRYFIERHPRANGAKPRRWVLYPGATEASSVPAAWHAWLHFATEATAQTKR